MKGQIYSFDSLASHDGEGIRSYIYLQGCNMSCWYCHNADSILPNRHNAKSVNDILKKVLPLKSYYGKKGGVTIGGGEPLLQAKFVIKLIKKLKKHNINVVIDTNASILNNAVKKIIELADAFLCDLKFATSEEYQKYCCGNFENVMEFLNYLDNRGKPFIVRTVIVPGLNSKESDVLKYYNIVKKFKNLKDYQLLAFQTLGFDKWDKCGMQNMLSGVKALSPAVHTKLTKYLNTLKNKKAA